MAFFDSLATSLCKRQRDKQDDIEVTKDQVEELLLRVIVGGALEDRSKKEDIILQAFLNRPECPISGVGLLILSSPTEAHQWSPDRTFSNLSYFDKKQKVVGMSLHANL